MADSSGKKRDLQNKSRGKHNRKRRKGGGIDSLDVSELDIDYRPLVIDSATGVPVAAANVSSTDIVQRIRIIRPYPFTFTTFAKQRWLGRSILDVYHSEFGSYPRAYYESAINEGRILVSGKQVSCDYLIAQHDELSHTVHRHEPAVSICDGTLASPGDKRMIEVVHEDEDIIVVDKPSTLPIHPCGGYNYNSLIHILAAQDPTLKDRLSPIHRLDRLTSGLSIIAKKKDVAKKMGKCILDREHCEKVYLAKVRGKFPCDASTDKRICLSNSDDSDEEPCRYGENRDGKSFLGYWVTDCNGKVQRRATLRDVFESRRPVEDLLDELANAKNGRANTGGCDEKLWFHLACPCRIASHKNGVCEAGEFPDLDDESAKKVKPAQTAFAVVAYDEKSDSTIVLVKPETGRMHQIRLHCQYLNHPIVNDVNYGGELFFGDPAASLASQKAKEKINKIDNSVNRPGDTKSADAPQPASEREVADVAETTRTNGETLLDFIQKTCVWCARSKGEDREVLEFLARSRGIYLHALQYSLKIDDDDGRGDRNLSYRTALPEWAESGRNLTARDVNAEIDIVP